MSTLLKHVSIASMIALMPVGTAGLAQAGSLEPETSIEDDYAVGRCDVDTEDCEYKHSRRHYDDEDEGATKHRSRKDDGEINVNVTVTKSDDDWKYDSHRHRRLDHRDAEYRYYRSGFWYPQPYWLGYAAASDDRLSCWDGGAAVRDRGFYRVKPIDCRGRTFTYLAHRRGETFKVIVSARSGRIVEIDPI